MSSAHGSTTKRSSRPSQSSNGGTWVTTEVVATAATTSGCTVGTVGTVTTSGCTVGTGSAGTGTTGTGDGTGSVTFSTVPLNWSRRSRRSRSGAQAVRVPKVVRAITRATRFKDTNHILRGEGLSKKTLGDQNIYLAKKNHIWRWVFFHSTWNFTKPDKSRSLLVTSSISLFCYSWISCQSAPSTQY